MVNSKRMMLALLTLATIAMLQTGCGKSNDDGVMLLPLGLATGASDEGGPGVSPADAATAPEVSSAQNAVTAESGQSNGSADEAASQNSGGAANEGAESGGSAEDSTDDTALAEDSDEDESESNPQAEDPTDDVVFEDDDDSADTGESGENGIGSANESGANCSARTITIDPAAGKWYETPQSDFKNKNGKTRKISGLHTYWQDQTLLVRVRKNCKAGWYKMRVVARNISGPLPSWYSHFILSVKDTSRSFEYGGLHIKASDQSYHGGSRKVYLPEGDSDLSLTWINDAWQDQVYDANIQVKSVVVTPAKKGPAQRKLGRAGVQYCSMNGRWFADGNAMHTFWANQSLTYCYSGLKPGKYEVTVEAKNYGSLPLPPGYNAFQFKVSGDGTSASGTVAASARTFEKGKVVVDLTGGNVRLDFTWTNDAYTADKYDANIAVKAIRLKRIGDSERSAVTAYLGNHLSASLLMSLTALTGLAFLGYYFYYLRKKRVA